VRGVVVSALSAVPGIGLIWLGVTWVAAAGGLTLGLLGARGERRLLAWIAIGVGAGVITLCAVFSDWGSET
jgi:hypothetical protein